MLFIHNGCTVNRFKNYPIKCHGCVFKCNLADVTNMQVFNCMGSQYIIWPGKNLYLVQGMTALLKDTYYNIHSGGLLFVDFTHDYLSFFSNDTWINLLEKVPLEIILLTEQTMEPLANYWKQNDNRIAGVLSVKTYRPFRLRNPRRVDLAGRSRKIKTATAMEVKVMELLLSGNSAREAGKALNISTKSVFNLQYSLERKFGKTLKEMLIR